MAELELQLDGSPFTATQTIALTVPADFSLIRLISTGGGPCVVTLRDGTTDLFTLVADTGRPDEYRGTSSRKLRFSTNIGIVFTGVGTGKIYFYFT